MLTSLFANIQSLFSRAFIIAHFVPALIFGFLNLVMLYWESWRARELLALLFKDVASIRSVWILAGAALAVAVLAYVASGLAIWQRTLLEGRWPEALARPFRLRHAGRLTSLTDDIANVQRTRGALKAQQWEDELRKARKGDVPSGNTHDKRQSILAQIDALKALQRKGALLPPADLERIVTALVPLMPLAESDADPETGRLVDEAQVALVQLVDYATRRAIEEHNRLENRRQFNYGTVPVAPTTMGNVASTVQTYAETRYNMNLEILWTSLQRSLQKDEKTYATLQDAKTQLDFLVSCFSFSVVWWACWFLWESLFAQEIWPFLVVATTGPLAAVIWYRVAVEQYRVFADVLRTCVDLGRLHLLNDLNLVTVQPWG